MIASIFTPIIYSLVLHIRQKASCSSETSLDDEMLLKRTSAIMYKKILGMPKFLGIPMLILTLKFDLYGILICGRRFQKQSVQQREKQIRHWKNSIFGPCRDFIDFYQKLIFFIYYSEKS